MVNDGVVGLGGATGPDNIQGMAAEQGGQALPRVSQDRRGARTGAVERGRVAAEVLGDFEPGLPRFPHDRSGGIVIKVNHWPASIRFAVSIASFLCAAAKGSEDHCRGASQIPPSGRRPALRASDGGAGNFRPPAETQYASSVIR